MALFQADVNGALAGMRQWLLAKHVVMLPSDAADMPRGCPLWQHGLSLAQADWVLAVLKQEIMDGSLELYQGDLA